MASAEYHVITTLQWADRSGDLHTMSLDGTYTPGRRETRQHAYEEIVRHTRQTLGVPPGAGAVLFFSMESNDL